MPKKLLIPILFLLLTPLFLACASGETSTGRDAKEQYALGLEYYNKKDYANALIWFTKSAEKGNAAAQYNSGLLYRNGLGTKLNYVEAVELYTKAAEQGFGLAQRSLGDLYANGKGVSANKVVSYMWLDLAKNKLTGYDQTVTQALLTDLESKMTQTQITKAQGLANACRLQNFKNCGK